MLIKKTRLDSLKLHPFFSSAHFEKPRGSEEQNFKYCSKEGDYKCKGFKVKLPLKILKEYELDPWMRSIISIFDKEVHPRRIHWLVDKMGGVGKSKFIKYCAVKYNCLWTTGGNVKDISNLCFNNIDYLECTEKAICLFDIPKCNKGHVSYNVLEMLKNGMMTNTKYECKNLIFNSPHVFIFSNSLPDTSKMSLDRWKVFNVVDGLLTPYDFNAKEENETVIEIYNYSDESE